VKVTHWDVSRLGVILNLQAIASITDVHKREKIAWLPKNIID